MEHEPDKIHIMPLGGQWEVEAPSGVPLAHETTKEDAIKTAKKLAKNKNIRVVVLHDGYGVTEEIIVAQ